MRRLLLATLLCAACQAPRQPPIYVQSGYHEGEARAAWVVWRFYGMTTPPPSIRWVEGEAVKCRAIDGQMGWNEPGFEGYCILGLTETPALVKVAWRPGDFFATTALAHEYEHAALMKRGLSGDPNHVRPEWLPGGEVEQANRALVLEGL